MRFALFVEGHTELALPGFLKRWLDPRLPRPIRIAPVNLEGSGGYLANFAQRARKDLASGQLIAVVGLLDLYGAAIEFPPGLDAKGKCTWAKADLENRVDDSRFRQHFAVHETEAWLLSDPGIFPSGIARRIESLADHPEAVDLQEPPSKLLRRVYRAGGRDYKKVVDGSALFERLDPIRAQASCPHLSLLLNDMLSLARAL